MIDNVSRIEGLIDEALKNSNILKTLTDTAVPTIKRAEIVIVLKGVNIGEDDRRELRSRYVSALAGWKAMTFKAGKMQAVQTDETTRLTLEKKTRKIEIAATLVTLIGFETIKGEQCSE